MSVDRTLENWVNNILANYRKKVSNPTFPIDEKTLVNVIEEKEGIDIELIEKETVNVGKDEGILVPKRGGFLLQYGKRSLKEEKQLFNLFARSRFTICHELAHIFFYDCRQEIPKMAKKPHEYICDSIARRFLLPKGMLEKEFSKRYRSDYPIIPFLRGLGRETGVGLYPLVKRLTEELSLIDDAMITFWKHNNNSNIEQKNAVEYRNYRKDSKTCPRLRTLLPNYWRDRIHLLVWKKFIKEGVVNGKIPSSTEKMFILSKKRIHGKKKIIAFKVECETLARDPSLYNGIGKRYDFFSVEKFDTGLLAH